MMGKRAFLKNQIVRLARDESGQTTAEYVFLLVMVIFAVKALGGSLKDRLSRIMNAAFDEMESEVKDR